MLDGEALLIIEGQERPLRRWDFVHCPAGTNHTILGAGDAPCVVLAVGSRTTVGTPDWGAYTVDEAAIRHDAGVEEETPDASGPTPGIRSGADALPRGLAARVARPLADGRRGQRDTTVVRRRGRRARGRRLHDAQRPTVVLLHGGPGSFRPLLLQARLRPPRRRSAGRLPRPARTRPLRLGRARGVELRDVRRRRARLLRCGRDRRPGDLRALARRRWSR